MIYRLIYSEVRGLFLLLYTFLQYCFYNHKHSSQSAWSLGWCQGGWRVAPYLKPLTSTSKFYSPTETEIHLIMNVFPYLKNKFQTASPWRGGGNPRSHFREGGRLSGGVLGTPPANPASQSSSACNYLGEVSYKVPWVIIQNILNGPFWGRYQG